VGQAGELPGRASLQPTRLGDKGGTVFVSTSTESGSQAAGAAPDRGPEGANPHLAGRDIAREDGDQIVQDAHDHFYPVPRSERNPSAVAGTRLPTARVSST
jgi:hypothetical protein